MVGTRPRPRLRRWWLAAGLVVVLVVAGAVVWLARGRARPVTVEEARQRLRPGATIAPGADRPSPGVYEYRGSGVERLTLPPLSQPEGPTLPGTVTLRPDGCWTFRIDYSTNHWQTWTYCRRNGDLEEGGGQSWQRWMIGPTAFTNLSTFVCDAGTMVLPSARVPGQEWPARCTGTSDSVKGVATSSGPYRFVGEDRLDVGGTPVTAAHFLRLRDMTGAQQGTERSDVWFADDTGLPIRNERSIRVRTDTPIGSSTYTETGEFSLVSAVPHR